MSKIFAKREFMSVVQVLIANMMQNDSKNMFKVFVMNINYRQSHRRSPIKIALKEKMWQKSTVSIFQVIKMKSCISNYHAQGSVSTLTKRIIIFFKKWISFLNFEIILFSIIYYTIVMWVVNYSECSLW